VGKIVGPQAHHEISKGRPRRFLVFSAYGILTKQMGTY